ncbi:MAG: glycosyltransferase, partial [Candidatus Omnitrophica bacterium]|nr:glycosyltransferase [Candidatus Omnitrophota bacterium]
MKDNGADFKVVIAGGGPLEERLKNDAAGRGLTGLIEFAGWKKNDELPEIYSASDVVVVPSVFDSKGESEGMPVVINEAFAAGVPVLASGISGITDLVENGRNGWLAEAED